MPSNCWPQIKAKWGEWIAAAIIVCILAVMGLPYGFFLFCTRLFGMK